MELRETVFNRPPDSRGTAPVHGSFGLPPELLVPARRRLSWIAIAFAAVSGLGFFVTLGFDNLLLELVQVAGTLAGLLMAGLARSERLSHDAVLKLGLAFLVFNCGIDSIAVPFFIFKEAGYIPVLTWTSIYIAVYPLAIPSPPLRTFGVSLAAAAMVPLGLLSLDALGAIEASGLAIAGAMVNPIFCVGIATLGAKVIHGINRDFARAKALGSYRLVERLGGGGMGEVWRAEHALLARPAAIKLIQPQIVAESSVAAHADLHDRFAREAQATAALRSPHTIELWDFGLTPDGSFYYVMELLAGLDLAHLVKRHGPLAPERVAHVMVQACASLAEAHAEGLVHRDVKPANVVLCRYGLQDDFVKVLDFGLVTVAAGVELGTERPGKEEVRGTPAYMSPEQVERPQSVDGRADLYMLGGVAYYLLTGRRPFERDGTMQTLMAHVTDAPIPPSRLADGIPPELEAIVLACLAKKPADRPATAEELTARLEATGLPGRWTPERARAWWAEHGEATTLRS